MSTTTNPTVTPTTYAGLQAATIHEAAGRIGALPSRVQAAFPGARVGGPAFPVRCAPGDNLWLHRALYAAQPGDVLVVRTDAPEFGYWGEILSVAAAARGLGGLVIDGGVRDRDQLAAVGLPVFASRSCLQGTVKDSASPGSLGEPIRIGEVEICRGDLVVGDCDGVVVIPAGRSDEVIAAGAAREATEAEVMDALRGGATTLDLFDLPAVPVPGAPADSPPAGSTGHRSIDVAGLSHAGNPIPGAAVVRGVLFSGGVHGATQDGGLPDDARTQIELTFANIDRLVQRAGGTVADIVRVSVTLRDGDLRPVLNEVWLSIFPDPDDRPARHVTVSPSLHAALHVQCEVVAVLAQDTTTTATSHHVAV